MEISTTNFKSQLNFFYCTILFVFLVSISGCTSLKTINSDFDSLDNNIHYDDELSTGNIKAEEKVEVKKFLLSPGDEIKISVFGYEELTRSLIIPPEQKFYYPIVGEISSAGKSLEELREFIKNSLSNYKELFLVPGDEISISVYGDENLTRNITIPADGYIFYPMVGEVETKGLTLRDLRNIIAKRLSEYRNVFLSPGDTLKITIYGHDDLTRTITIPADGKIFFPLVGEIKIDKRSTEDLRKIICQGLSEYDQPFLLPGDQLSITVYRHDELSRSIIIPPSGRFFYPLAGELNSNGKSISELRTILSEKLSSTIEDPQVSLDIISFNRPKKIIDPQVSVDIVSLGTPKILVDPQVSVDIHNMNNPKTVSNPQVTVEVLGFGGEKFYIFGEVTKPGVYLSTGNTNLVEAISLAGGLTLDGNQNSVLLIRGGKGKTKPDLFVADVEKLITRADMSQNPIIQKGDIVYVSRTFISNVDRFFKHLALITRPLLDIETGYWIGQNISVGPERATTAR